MLVLVKPQAEGLLGVPSHLICCNSLFTLEHLIEVLKGHSQVGLNLIMG